MQPSLGLWPRSTVRYRDLPIRKKLYLTTALAVGFALIIAAAAMLVYESRTFRPRTLAKADTQGRILSEILVPPMLFNDSITAAIYLATLRYWPEVSEAALFDSRWNIFAEYRRDTEPKSPSLRGHPDLETKFGARALTFTSPVIDRGRRLGYLAFRHDLPPLYARLPQYPIMFGVVMLSLIALAGMLTLALKYGVTAPITALAETAKAVTEGKDYRLRASPGDGDEVGSMTRAFNQMLDAIEQRDLSLRESRHLLQSIIDFSAAVIYVKDLEGRYLLINRRYEELFHITKEAIRGHTDRDLFPEESANVFQANDLRALEEGRPVEYEETASQDDGLHTYISIKYPLRDDSGKPYALCGISTDITQIKAYEGQLRQSQKMEAIGRLAGGISHDFNNLLMAINGYSSMALEGMPPTDPHHNFIVEVLKAGERAAGLTRQLLAYSRMQILEPRILNLNEIVADLEKMLRRLIGEDVDLVTSLTADLGPVRADRGQVEQVLLNLSINARDAMPRGGRLTLETQNVVLDRSYASTHPEVDPGTYVVLIVSDTGTGMTPDVLAQIFEPFFTTKELGKGTGLGLSVVYGIVKQSGGTISVVSEPGKGTTFRVYFPESFEVPGHAPSSMPLSTGQAFRGSETLLLVEDEEQVRGLGRHILESQGYRVVEAFNGVNAMETAAGLATSVQMVVTDVVMPVMGGPELAERFRNAYGDIPILFMSGYAETAVGNKGIFDGSEQFLQKPFTPFDLIRKVREMLDQARSRPPAS